MMRLAFIGAITGAMVVVGGLGLLGFGVVMLAELMGRALRMGSAAREGGEDS